MIVEMGLAAIAAIVWAKTARQPSHAMAYNVMFIGSVSTLLFNGNPLLRYDGYYILSDLLEIPNLAQRSQGLSLLPRQAVRAGTSEAPATPPTPPARSLVVVYGVSSTIYRVFISWSSCCSWPTQSFLRGLLLAVAAVIAWTCVPLGKFVHYLVNNNESIRVRGRAIGSTLAMLALIGCPSAQLAFP